MNKYLFLVLTFLSQIFYSQFISPSEVKNIVGTGTKIAYFVADFRDGTDDSSYVWGVRFNPGENMSGPQMLQKIAAAEPKFSSIVSSGFLDKVQFNAHSEESGSDWWSLWAGDGSTWSMAGWMNSGSMADGEWYGATYGWNPEPLEPVTPLPAYSSTWFPMSSITNWIGTGTNKSIVVVDFGTDNGTNADSFAFGIQYNGSITAQQALQLIASQGSNFSFTATATQVNQVTFNSNSGTNGGSNVWKSYKGTNLSDWKTQTDLSQITLNNNDWFGLSFGTRRPYIPQASSFLATQNTNFAKQEINIYPNPTTDFVQVNTSEKIISINAYSVSGQIIATSSSSKIDLRSASNGIYILEVKTTNAKKVFKVVKQ